MPADEKSLLNSNKRQNYGTTAASSTSGSHSDISQSVPEESPDITSETPLPHDHSLPLDQMKSSLTFYHKIGFGLGHVFNDLCAGVWFSYTLLFMQGALEMPGAVAGTLVMLGQVSDALATPIVGVLADKYGTKRKWHIAGTGLVFLSFPLIFSICPWCTTAPIWWRPTYFALVIVLFQLGWAIVQITHLAMIPEMSRSGKDRSDLTAIRYSASVCSNVIVYIVTWLVLRTRSEKDSNIGPEDAYRFRDVSLILTIIGIYLTVCFHFCLSLSGYKHRRKQALDYNQRRRRLSESRDPLNSSESPNSSINTTTTPRRQKNFLKSPLLYQNAFLYVFSRLFMTTALIYIPLWLDERTWQVPINETNVGDPGDNSVEHIATVPLVSFLSSFMASMTMKYANRLFGHRVAYLMGSVISISGCVWVLLAASPIVSTIKLYAIAFLFGTGSSITMISSLCITADMIGKHADQGGFVYSAVTFADKLITGVVVVVIEALKCEDRTQCPEYYRRVLAYTCGVAAILGLFILTTLQCTRRTATRRLQAS